MKRVPVIDLGECRNCDACLEICSAVFLRNTDTGLIEVADLSEYPESELDEAIALCPEDCIAWELVSGFGFQTSGVGKAATEH